MHSLIDIGANLTHDSFDADRQDVMARAATAGVHRIIITGTTVSASEAALTLAEQSNGALFATAGIHPHHASELDADTIVELRKLLDADVVVAVGECGLDFNRNYSPDDAQLAAFEAQLELATEVGKPIFLHQRDAHEPFVTLLRKYMPKINGGVAHCFTGTRAQMSEYLELGLHIGITGWICDERRGAELRDAVSELPLERVLLETDAPYLLPRDLTNKPSGRRNEPAVLPHILTTLAHYMGTTKESVAAAATRNSERLFRLPPVTPSP